MVKYKNQIFIFGGYDGQDRLNDLWSFNLETKTWREIIVDFIPKTRNGMLFTLN